MTASQRRERLLEETNSSGVALADYIYLDGRPIAVLNGSTLYYLHDDMLGTPAGGAPKFLQSQLHSC